MCCPKCETYPTATLDSRPTAGFRPGDRKPFVRRRRECPTCKHRWTTVELESAATRSAYRYLAGDLPKCERIHACAFTQGEGFEVKA